MIAPLPIFPLQATVYHRVRPGVAGMVTGIIVRPTGLQYLVTWGEDLEEFTHYEIELTDEKTFGEAA